MWICKECGGEIIAIYGGYAKVSKLGTIIKGTEYNEGFSHYKCEDCSVVIEVNKLKEYAVWED
jgi:hypothetical protein